MGRSLQIVCGAGGVEVSLAIARRLQYAEVEIALFCAEREVLGGYNGRSRAAVMAALEGLGVRVHLDARVESVEPSCLHTAGGGRTDFDDLFWCTGAAAAAWVKASGLATDERGFLAVRDTLQSLSDDEVFAAVSTPVCMAL